MVWSRSRGDVMMSGGHVTAMQIHGRRQFLNASGLMRQFILRTAASPRISRLVHRYGRYLGARRFVAGETLEEAVAVAHRLNVQGIAVTFDHLGEDIHSTDEARSQADVYVRILEALDSAKVDANVSLKLTQMGLDIDRAACMENMRMIVAAARRSGNFVRIDMEDAHHTDATLDVLHELRRDYDRIGTVLQAYLYRTQGDLTALLASDINVRIVKGAYLEPPEIAFPQKADVDRNYLQLVDRALREGHYVAVATHDEQIISQVEEWVAQRQTPRDRFEFQMLYGIRMQRQRELAERGYRVRCYVPYGDDWYAYFMRRLAERPANILFVVRNLFRS